MGSGSGARCRHIDKQVGRGRSGELRFDVSPEGEPASVELGDGYALRGDLTDDRAIGLLPVVPDDDAMPLELVGELSGQVVAVPPSQLIRVLRDRRPSVLALLELLAVLRSVFPCREERR